MKTVATNKKLRELIVGIRNKTLIPRPEFQRRLVWANKHKLAFLETVLSEYPFPEIYVAAADVNPETGEGSEMLVDGQQRITTLYQYFTGSAEIKLDGEVPKYSALTENQKIAFLEYDVVVRNLGKLSIGEIKEVFRKINSTNYALNAMEIHNARFEGAFKSFAERVSQNRFFEERRIFTSSDVRRMNDLRYVLTVIVTLMSTYFNRDDELESYLKNYNDEFDGEAEIWERLQIVFDFIDKCQFSPKSRVWKKTDLFTLIIELDRAINRHKLRLLSETVARNLNGFYDLVDSVGQIEDPRGELLQYYKASLQATNDRGSRIRRGEVIQDIIGTESDIDWDQWTHADHIEAVKQVIDWFLENYEDPANNVSYDSGKGGYQYVNGGPYHPMEVLRQKFESEPAKVIEEAVQQVVQSGGDWVRKGQY
jgi:hypothetical protein